METQTLILSLNRGIVSSVTKKLILHNISYDFASTQQGVRKLNEKVDVIILKNKITGIDYIKLNGDADHILREIFHQLGLSNPF
jgi:hypothetical protein